jgi:hypothetical protein
VRVHLADDEDLLARQRPVAQGLGQRSADHFLGAAFAVHLGSVDHAPAEIERRADGGHFARAPRRALAHAPGAQPERRKLHIAGECHHETMP